MTKDEALKLALDALEKNHYYMIDAGLPNQSMLNKNFEAITACEKALSAPVHEPVAWLVYAKGSRKYFTLTFDLNKVPEIYIGGEALPLYTTPPAQPLYTTPPAAQRQWVGLTDEEIIDVIHPLVMADMPDEATDYEIARAIEAKLKEKNT
jgi:hypothetical protein